VAPPKWYKDYLEERSEIEDGQKAEQDKMQEKTKLIINEELQGLYKEVFGAKPNKNNLKKFFEQEAIRMLWLGRASLS